jgi:hypothetical protein
MNAEQIYKMSVEVYNELANLDYHRKENDLVDIVNSVDFDKFSKQAKEAVRSLPTLLVKPSVDLMDIELDGKQQFYIFNDRNRDYLVDTQGFNYPRYVIKLQNLEFEDDDQYEMMEGLTPITDIEIIALALKSIVIDLAQEGFSQKDVEEYLTMKLEFMAKEVCATNTRLF